MIALRLLLTVAAVAAGEPSGASTATPADSLCARMEAAGMVDAAAGDPAIKVSLMYGRDDNFTGAAMYPEGFVTAYLHPEAAAALVKAQEALTASHPGLRLLVADAARPMSVQRKMYNVVKGTPQAPYVSNPANGGGLHNYGLAVDITIVDAQGKELPMGTKVDHLGKEAHIDTETAMVKAGILTARHKQNRELLRRVMREAGFRPLRTEWWHFNFKSRAEAKAHYKVLNF